MAKLIRFPEAMETRLAAMAERERRTFTAQVLLLLEQRLEQIDTEERRRREGRHDA